MAVRFSGYEEWTLSEAGFVARSLGHLDRGGVGNTEVVVVELEAAVETVASRHRIGGDEGTGGKAGLAQLAGKCRVLVAEHEATVVMHAVLIGIKPRHDVGVRRQREHVVGMRP